MRVILLFALLFSKTVLFGQPVFKVIPLGVKGGVDKQNLSANLIAATGSDQYVCFDAGTLYAGIVKSISKGSLRGVPEHFMKDNIKGYLISHAHLDHVAGLILNSADDSPKNIYSLPKCLEIIKNHYFNWGSWAKFGDDGKVPALKKILTQCSEYQY